MKKTIILLLFVSALFNGSAQADSTVNSLVWKMYQQGSSDTSYLVGTIHLPLKRAFEAVDTVSFLLKKVEKAYFELEYNPLAFTSQGMFFIAKEDSERVKNLLNEQEYDLLHKKASEVLGQQAMVIDMMKPIGIMSLFALSMSPSDTTGAMDILFQMEAKKMGVKVGGLETAEQQMEVLKKMTLSEQKDELVDLLLNYEQHTLQFDSLLEAYLAHDLITLKKLTNESFSDSTQAFKEEVLDKRNLEMVVKIDKQASKKPCLFAVGAAHLVGQQGLLSLLNKKGYTLIAIK